MPNRILKESICTSETTDQLSDAEERFFTRLIVQCDDYGRMDARPAILRARCFPLRIALISEAMIEGWITKLAEVGLLYVYPVKGRPYLEMATWDKHQTIRNKRSKWPGPEDSDCTQVAVVCKQLQADASTCARNPNPNQNPNIHAQIDAAPIGAESVEDKSKRAKRTRSEAPERFGEFWEAYPRRVARAVAVKAYSKCLQEGATAEAMITGAGNYAQECIMTARARQYICFPTTFLNQWRFEDHQLPPDPADFASKPIAPMNNRTRKPIEEGPEYEVFTAKRA